MRYPEHRNRSPLCPPPPDGGRVCNRSREVDAQAITSATSGTAEQEQPVAGRYAPLWAAWPRRVAEVRGKRESPAYASCELVNLQICDQ